METNDLTMLFSELDKIGYGYAREGLLKAVYGDEWDWLNLPTDAGRNLLIYARMAYKVRQSDPSHYSSIHGFLPSYRVKVYKTKEPEIIPVSKAAAKAILKWYCWHATYENKLLTPYFLPIEAQDKVNLALPAILTEPFRQLLISEGVIK